MEFYLQHLPCTVGAGLSYARSGPNIYNNESHPFCHFTLPSLFTFARQQTPSGSCSCLSVGCWAERVTRAFLTKRATSSAAGAAATSEPAGLPLAILSSTPSPHTHTATSVIFLMHSHHHARKTDKMRPAPRSLHHFPRNHSESTNRLLFFF